MSEKTKIQWCDSTWNPVQGCTKISPGCAHCYAERSLPARFHGIGWGDSEPRRLASAATWRLPFRWARRSRVCDACGYADSEARYAIKHCDPETGEWCQCETYHRRRVFACSLSDWLDQWWPIGILGAFLETIRATPTLDWLLLTKRVSNWEKRLRAAAYCCHEATRNWVKDWLDGTPPPNVWFGVSVENQDRDSRIREAVKVPAVRRWLSLEPLLGPVDVRPWLPPQLVHPLCPVKERGQIDWLVIGGESGPQARPCNVEWIRDLLRQGWAAGLPVFVKQLGGDPRCPYPLGVPAWGRLRLRHPKGGDPAEWPPDLRVREWPQ